MSESPPDDARLRATEAQMRQALGLRGDTTPRATPDHPATLNSVSHPQRRRFVRDGEVPVTIIHRDHRQDDLPGSNQFEAAKHSLRAETAAREHAERLLGEAQNTIRDLQTKLAHERLAKDEAIQATQQAETDKRTVLQTLQTVQDELSVERLHRQTAEHASAEAQEARRLAEQRLQDIRTTARNVRRPSEALQKLRPAVEPGDAARGDAAGGEPERAKTPAVADESVRTKPARRRGRPPGAAKQESEIVEWWIPGWQEKFR